MSGRKAFVFDPDRCTSCEACRVACGIENGAGKDVGWRTVTTFNPSRHPALPVRHLSLACNHCETPACAAGCPANAYEVDANGAVLIDPKKCIGCRYCSWVCPYDAPKYDAQESVMTKCTFCSHRLAESMQPACTSACPTGALSFGSRDALEPEPSYHGLGTTGLGPSLRIVQPRSEAPPPALAIDDLLGIEPSQPPGPPKITARTEWALVLFSLVMPLLAGWVGASLVRPDRAPDALVFLGLGALVMAASTAHLGRPLRAWRAVLNVRRSWLSREIVAANLFLALGTLYLVVSRNPVLGFATGAAGAALCVAIDGVYRAIPRVGIRRAHSAEAVLTFALFFGIVSSAAWVTWAAAIAKAILFARRFAAEEFAWPAPAAALRVIPLAFACVTDLPWAVAAACAAAGEVIDRAAFYEELEPATPALRMAAEVRERMEAATP